MSNPTRKVSNGNVDPPRDHHIAKKKPPSRKQKQADTVFQRFVQKIGEYFKAPKTKVEHPLSGRISELQTSATDVLLELIAFKLKMEKDADNQLYAFVCTSIDPIIKELTRIQQLADRDGNAAQKVKSFSRYVEWIEKAREWVDFGKTQTSDEMLQQAVIEQTAKEFLGKIDRDLKIIQDYMSHMMNDLDLAEEIKKELNDKLMPGLKPTIQSLQSLYKLRPQKNSLSLEAFIHWRLEADRDREDLYNKALHIIDTFAEEFLPSPVKEIETGHALASMTQLNYVEGRINEVAKDLDSIDLMDETKRKNYLTLLDLLDQEINALNGNLHLSHEQHERLQQTMESLSELRERLLEGTKGT